MNENGVIAKVLNAEDRRFDALAANDLNYLPDTLADDLRYVHANGLVEDKLEFLRKLTSGERRYLSFVAVDRRAYAENGFVFVYGDAEMEVERKEGKISNRLTYTAVYRDGETPQLMSWQSTKSFQ
ncbi:nuclear transport factor 2 family protein [Sphingopyxis granuli]|uniref:nuclear transport factor 2 family protein n=1 Tax=Sphingopyxis granuli TaxID=267128 RepID=UPI001BAF3971|nr:nuclear transport factor 2 family protein [Sphingopyxis granuli]QUM71023.1 nuclear transport factor 2 family protein [Sphingopyxis granuli]